MNSKNMPKHRSYSPGCLQCGPLPVITVVISPMSRVVTPATHVYSHLQVLFHPAYKWLLGPPCRDCTLFFEDFCSFQ